jgi:hypothetical protein
MELGFQSQFACDPKAPFVQTAVCFDLLALAIAFSTAGLVHVSCGLPPERMPDELIHV